MAQATKTITVRLPSAIYDQVLKVAENTNANLAEATRTCLSEHFNQIKIDAHLTEINETLSRIENSVNELGTE
jgi:hypothetical protein